MDPLDALRSRLSEGAVSVDPADRATAGRDMSPLAFLHELYRDPNPGPDAVVFPASTEEVVAVLAWAGETGASVVPRGGGSGVVGGARASEGDVVLDLSRMDRVLEVDEVSLAVEVEAGCRGDRLEEALEPYGLTTGHYPQSIAISTVGGWIAASSAGQASAGFGVIENLVLGLTAVLADGTVVELRPVPRSAAGPDLRRLFVGSEGTLAVVTRAVLSVALRPKAWVWETLRFADLPQAAEAMRRIVHAGLAPLAVRAYDEADARLAFGSVGHELGAVGILGFDGRSLGVEARRAAAREHARQAGGSSMPAPYGDHWWRHRNEAVELYRAIMGPQRSFGPGVVVDTMEVAGLWRGLPDLYGSIREALLRRAESVGCHLSHPYRSGASLYFTFLIRASDDPGAEKQYMATWKEAVAACHAAGGTMTHHHGVGSLKRPFMERELGEGGAAVLRRIKRALDPEMRLNGGLIP